MDQEIRRLGLSPEEWDRAREELSLEELTKLEELLEMDHSEEGLHEPAPLALMTGLLTKALG